MTTPSIPALSIERHRLENGLEVVLHSDHSLPLVAVNLWYHVGSKNERPGRTGLAHLFEHMLFQGSENVGTNDHFRLVQQAGGVANGSTWFDRTNYYETMPANYLDLALWLESDRMGFLLPALDQEKLENQRSVVMNERRERIDNQPYGRAFERIHELLYPEGHPYHWPVIGYMDDIAGASLEDVEAFFRAHYTPNNSVLTLAGDFDAEEAMERVDHFFSPVPPGQPTSLLAAPPLGDRSRRREVMEDDVELARIYLASTVPAFGEDDWYAVDLLATVLSGGKSSPLYADLVYSQQLATDVSAFVLPTEIAATFMLVATARPGTDIEALELALNRHLAAIAKEGPSEADLGRARNKVITALSDQYQKLDQRADLLSMFTTYFDDPHRLQQELETYLELDREDLARVADHYLQTDAQVSLAIVAKSKS